MSEQKQFLTEDDIKGKLAYLDSLKGREPDRDALLKGIEDKYIWLEVWSRETGHMWEYYSFFKRTPTKEETDYADLEKQEPLRLGNMSTSIIRDLFIGWRDKNLYKN